MILGAFTFMLVKVEWLHFLNTSNIVVVKLEHLY